LNDISYSDKKEYEAMTLVRMTNNNSHHKSLFINEHIFEKAQAEFHRHEYMQINYVSEGSGYCEFEDGIARFTQGSCFIIPPYVPHRIITGENVDNVKICEIEFMFDFVFPPSHEIEDMEAYSDFICLGLPDSNEREYSKHIINLDGNTREKVEIIINDALDEYNNTRAGFETALRSLILYLLTILGRAYTGNENTFSDRYKKHRSDILKTIDYIHLNYEKNITLGEMSRLINYSTSYFSTLFKSVTSKSYIEYLNHYRIKKAMELLKNTDMRVIDVASSVGFENVSNFNRLFKKLIGMSPRDYKKLK